MLNTSIHLSCCGYANICYCTHFYSTFCVSSSKDGNSIVNSDSEDLIGPFDDLYMDKDFIIGGIS